MKKLFFALILVTVFFTILCISTSALEYGQEFLDPDYYEDDIVMVIGLYFNGDSWIAYPGNSGTEIFIPLYQIRVPESSGSQEYDAHLYVNDWTTESDGMFEFVVDFTLYEGSYASEYGSTVVDLSDFLVSGLQDYSIQSTLWDDPYFFLIDSSGFSEVIVGSYVDASSSSVIFFGLYCDNYLSYIPLPDPATLQIPTYPSRPLPPDPIDPPLIPGNINRMLGQIFGAPVDTISSIFTATNTLYAFLSVFSFVLFVRFIFVPLLGGSLFAGVSDHVRSSRRKQIDSERYGYYKNAHEYYNKKNRGG